MKALLRFLSVTIPVALLVLSGAGRSRPATAAPEPSSTSACDYWVAPSPAGDDANPGTQAQPWASLQHAAETIPDAGCTVWFESGVFQGEQQVESRFQSLASFKAITPYAAILENDGAVLSLKGARNLLFEGFEIRHINPAAGKHVIETARKPSTNTWTEDVIFRDNIIHDSYNNDLMKLHDGSRFITVEGNVFYNQDTSEQHMDVNSVTDVVIQDNLFFNDFAGSGRQSPADTKQFIVIKDSNEATDGLEGSERITLRRNVFLNWEGGLETFVKTGNDGNAFHEAEDVLVENNLLIGNSDVTVSAAFGVQGAKNVTYRNNTLTGDLPAKAYAFRVEIKSLNPQNENISFFNNIWSDSSGTMGADGPGDSSHEFSNGDPAQTANLAFDNNLYWNGGASIPPGDLVSPLVDDANRIVADPLLNTNHGSIVLPRWTGAAFLSGNTSIRQEFIRLVEAYGRVPAGSPALGQADPAQAPDDDILGNPRPADPGLGAYEYQGGPGGTATPTATNTPPPTATNTPLPTATNTPLPTATNTPLPTATNTPLPTATNTPLPTATNTPLPTATNTPLPTATNTPLPTATITPLPTATNTPLPTATNTPLPTATNTPLPTTTNTPLPTTTNTPLPTATGTALPTATNTPLPTATNTPLPTATGTALPTATSTPLPTATNTPLPATTNTPLPTATNTPMPTATGTALPTATNTPQPTATNTPLPTATSTQLPAATNTPLPAATSTPSPTVTSTPEATATKTPRPTKTPRTTVTNTPSPTTTNTPLPTATGTSSPTVTNTPSPTATTTALPTASSTSSPTATNTPSPTATNTPSPTATNTPSPTATNTPSPTATNTPSPTATNTPRPAATGTPLPPGANTGWLGPAANRPGSGGDGDGFESNPENGHADDSYLAVDADSGSNKQSSCASARKDSHQFFDYHFDLPAGVVVSGIEVRLDALVDNSDGSPIMCVQLSWDGGQQWSAFYSTPVLSVEEDSYFLGGEDDSWGHDWTIAELSEGNFRVRIVNVAQSAASDFSLDWLAVNVHYQHRDGPATTPTPLPVQLDPSVYLPLLISPD